MKYLDSAKKAWADYRSGGQSNGTPKRSFGEAINGKGTIIFMIVLLICGFIYWIYTRGKKEGQATLPDIPITPIENDGSVTEAWKREGDYFATEVFRLTDSVDWVFGRKTIAAKSLLYGKIVKVTKPQLAYIYDRFNQKYFAKNSETMTEAIEGDNHIWLPSPDFESELIAKLRQFGFN
jgi:hypothetical protein